jgi:hypothetical protein
LVRICISHLNISRLEPIEKAAAKERMEAGKASENFPEGRARERIRNRTAFREWLTGAAE